MKIDKRSIIGAIGVGVLAPGVALAQFLSPGSRGRQGSEVWPAGTQLMFVNPAAPQGWVRNSTFDDSLLRIVGSATPANGGANGFVSAFNSQTGTGAGTGSVNGSTGATTISTATLPAHTHSTPTGGSGTHDAGGCTGGLNNASNTGNGTGSGGSHSHTISLAVAVPSLSITTGIKYVDSLLAKKV